MKQKRDGTPGYWTRLFSSELDYPLDAMLDVPGIHITGSNTAVIEGCKGVLYYSESKLTLDMGAFSLTFHGIGLVLGNLSKANLSLYGQLTAVLFDKKEEATP